MISTVDPDARHIHKNRTRHQDGFKAHVSFEPETGLFTAVALTAGGGAGNHEAAVAAGLLAGEQGKLTILGDTAYGTGELREHLQASGHLAVIKPPPLPRAIPGGFTIDDFTIDDHAATVTCPAGRTVALGRPQADGNRQAQFKTRCRGCPLRERCTTATAGRVLTIHPHHALLAMQTRGPPPNGKYAYLGSREANPSAQRSGLNRSGSSYQRGSRCTTAPGHSHSASSHHSDTVSTRTLPGRKGSAAKPPPTRTPSQAIQDFQCTSRCHGHCDGHCRDHAGESCAQQCPSNGSFHAFLQTSVACRTRR